MKSKKDGAARETISQRVEKDREYNSLSKQKKNAKTAQLYNFYKLKMSSGKNLCDYEIDIDNEIATEEYSNELQSIYKLKQYDLVNATNVIFHKQGCDITSDDMSSGEFAMLSTVLSISAAANDPHTLVLLDEPELSLHPNWQMMLIDNLDRALKNQVCHLLIATHSHLLVSDLPLKRSSVVQLEKDREGNLKGTTISENTYGWSPEEVLLKVFQMSTDRNRYLAEMVGIFIKKISDNEISLNNAKEELTFLNKVAVGLSDVDPMKKIISTITEEFDKNG
jgi:predicted ATPase